jgi:4-hydroxy-2-oxoheptanedioate aldolase
MSRLRRTVQQVGAPLLGAGVYFYDPIFVEISAGLGYRIAWFDMEHSFLTFAQVADLCRIASARGMMTMIRIPDARRENVLKAAECGPDGIFVPMAGTTEILGDLARYSRFPPEGERGAFSISRATNFGLAGTYAEEQQRINRDLCVMGQIETVDAVDRAEELCAFPGTDVFIGPLDLSVSYGVPGQPGHPKVIEAAGRIISAARKYGKIVAVSAASTDSDLWIKVGVDIFLCTNDASCLRLGAQTALKQAQDAIAKFKKEAAK